MKYQKLKFSKCPIGAHKGENWQKLSIVQKDDVWILNDILYTWSDELNIGFIRLDTFHDWTHEDWRALMKKFYGMERVFGMVLFFKRVKPSGEEISGAPEITTFRAYHPWMARKFERCLQARDKIFKINIKKEKYIRRLTDY